MKKSGYIIALALALIVCLSLYGAKSWAGERIYQAWGQISAIDVEYKTVVVEVPVAGRTSTVGGPLSPGAILEKAGKPVDLGAFGLGDGVVVKWQVTNKGHTILALRAK